MSTKDNPGVIAQLARRIENYLGLMLVPVGEVRHFVLNGRLVRLPLATWERTVVAAVSKGAKLVESAGFSADTSGSNQASAQAAILHESNSNVWKHFGAISDVAGAALQSVHRDERILGEPSCHLVSLKGGVAATIVKVQLDAGQHMGAALASELAERLAQELAYRTGLSPLAGICSNENAGLKVLARGRWPIGGTAGISAASAQRITMMQAWARHDSSRSSTHNKGIMNAVCGVARATGQDIEAIQAAVLTRTALLRNRGAAPLTEFRLNGDYLEGQLALRLPLGVRGGATELSHAVRYRQIMRVETVAELAQVAAAAGLAANFAALHCLVNEGISEAARRTRTTDV